MKVTDGPWWDASKLNDLDAGRLNTHFQKLVRLESGAVVSKLEMYRSSEVVSVEIDAEGYWSVLSDGRQRKIPAILAKCATVPTVDKRRDETICATIESQGWSRVVTKRFTTKESAYKWSNRQNNNRHRLVVLVGKWKVGDQVKPEDLRVPGAGVLR